MPLRPDVRRLAALTLLLLAAVAAAAVGLRRVDQVAAAILLSVATAGACVTGTVLAFRRARRIPGEAAGWRLLGVALAMQAVYQAYPLASGPFSGSLPAFTDALYGMHILTLLAITAALLSWSGRPRAHRDRLRTTMDGFLFGTSLLFVIWAAALHDPVEGGLVRGLRLAGMITDFTLVAANLGIVIYLAASYGVRTAGALIYIGAALLAATGFNLVLMTFILEDSYFVGHPADALLLLAVGLFALSALAPGRVTPEESDPPPHRTPAGTALPYLPVLAVLFTLSILVTRPDVRGDWVLAALGIAIGLALLLRQQLALRDVETLSHHLTETVADRTRELARSQAALARAQRLEAVGRMAGGVARDFDRLIGELEEPVAALAAAVPSTHPDREAIVEIGAAGQRAQRLIGQLLTFAQRQPVEPRLVDVNALLADFLPLLRQLAGRAIALELKTAPGSASVFADPTQLEQLLSNLTVNARDAMPDGGTLSIAVAAGDHETPDGGDAEGGPWVRIAVRDTGVGMDETVLGHVFEPFFTTKPAGKGTGLGLPTCYGIVNRAGGRIHIESAPGAGTTVTILLPGAA